MRGSGDRLGDGRHPGDNLVATIVRDRFGAFGSVFDVIFSCGRWLYFLCVFDEIN